MTTNQTIDGVPCELLREWLKALNSRDSVPVAIRKMRNELRALLDAPAPAVDGEQWYTDTPDGDSALVTRVAALCKHPSMSFHQVALLEGAISDSKTAAQPQGEPVAWIKPDVLATLRKDECCYAFGEQSPKGNLVPLYAEQPKGGQVIDLDAVDWEAIQKAADESNWMPNEYMRNEWVADVCNFLKYGRAEQPVAKAKPVAKLHAERLTGKDGEYGVTVEDSQWFNTCRLTGGVFNLYAEQPAPVAVVMPERMEVPSADCPERINAQGWNACFDQLKRFNPSL